MTVRQAATVKGSAPSLIAIFPKTGATPRKSGVRKAVRTALAYCFWRIRSLPFRLKPGIQEGLPSVN